MSRNTIIALSFTSVSRDKWIVLYNFLNAFLKDNIDESIEKSLSENGIKPLNVVDDSCSRTEFKSIPNFAELNPDAVTAFWLLYNKQDFGEGLSALSYFVLLEKSFRNNLKLHLAIETDEYECRSKYDIFFSLVYDTSDVNGTVLYLYHLQNNPALQRGPLHPEGISSDTNTSRVIFPITQ